MVGVSGFEPPASCSQSRRANQAALHPDIKNIVNSQKKHAKQQLLKNYLMRRMYITIYFKIFNQSNCFRIITLKKFYFSIFIYPVRIYNTDTRIVPKITW